MTGWGRTGRLWGIDHWDTTPDIVATAKGMTAGYTPLSAVIARNSIWKVLQDKHSPFKAGHTLNANAVSCAGALAVLRYLQEHDLVENSRLRGEQVLAGLRQLMSRHPIMGDVRGLGLMFGLEYVRRRSTREPFAPDRGVSARIERAALKHGLVTYPCTGSIDGTLGDMTLMAPPLTISPAEVDQLLELLDRALADVEQELGQEIEA